MRWLERWLTGYEPRAALAQELGPMPSTHKMAHNPPYLQFRGIQRPLLASMGTACVQHIKSYSGKTLCNRKLSKYQYRTLKKVTMKISVTKALWHWQKCQESSETEQRAQRHHQSTCEKIPASS